MLQVFHMNVVKVDRMLHMLNEIHLPQLLGRRRVGTSVWLVGAGQGAENEQAREMGVQGNRPGGMGVRTRTCVQTSLR